MSARPTRAGYLARQRWFAGPAQQIARIEPRPWLREPASGLGVRFELVHLADGTVYNVPASYRPEPYPGLSGALMAVEDGLHVYDALADAHARTALLAGFFGETTPEVSYTALAPLGLRADVSTLPLIAEQSNTSIIVGETLLAKFFRIVVEGRNPDIEISRALTEQDSDHVAPVRGWISTGPFDLAMLYDYYVSATDGWDSARTSFRSLLAEPTSDPAAGGADFAPEARRLGATVRTVHERLARLGSQEWGAGDLTTLADHLQSRFADAVSTVPALAAHRAGAEAAFDELRSISEPVRVQRVHGDLHLGQTLRTIGGWVLIDFEGEPGAALDERTRLDSPLRDVAGILRSFDYAPHSVLLQTGQSDAEARRRAGAWARRNHEAFLEGYGVASEPTSYVLVRCYQIDKAAYEVAYETRHRPAWASLPSAALSRLLA